MILNFDFAGMSYEVEADVEDGYVIGVLGVSVQAKTGKYFPVHVNTDKFLEDMQDFLNDAVEQAIIDNKLAHEDYLFETAREEGKL
jgi:hypothetical protein